MHGETVKFTNALSCYWDKLDKVCMKDRGKESRLDRG